MSKLFFLHFVSFSGQPGLEGTRNHKQKHDVSHTANLWRGPVTNLHVDAPGLVPKIRQLPGIQKLAEVLWRLRERLGSDRHIDIEQLRQAVAVTAWTWWTLNCPVVMHWQQLVIWWPSYGDHHVTHGDHHVVTHGDQDLVTMTRGYPWWPHFQMWDYCSTVWLSLGCT